MKVINENNLYLALLIGDWKESAHKHFSYYYKCSKCMISEICNTPGRRIYECESLAKNNGIRLGYEVSILVINSLFMYSYINYRNYEKQF